MSNPKRPVSTVEEFIKVFHEMSARYGRSELWYDYIDMHAIALANTCDLRCRDAREEQYNAIVQKYDEKTVQQFAVLTAITMAALLENPEQDFLGTVYHNLGLSKSQAGQFFTPYNVGQMMARINMPDSLVLDKSRILRVNDPCCGAGCLLLAGYNKDATWQKRLAKKKTGLNKKYGALSVLNQIIPALTKELSSLFPKHFFVTNGKSTYDYRAAHGVSKDHWLDAYCIACSVLPNDTCDKTINSRVPYELKQFRRHDRRALNNENMSRVYTFNGKMVATNRHKATEQTTDSLEEFRQRQPNDVCNLKVKEHHPTYRNMNRNYPGSVFLVGNQVHVMQGIAGSKDGEATTYKDTNANSIAAGKCKFVAKNSGILFV